MALRALVLTAALILAAGCGVRQPDATSQEAGSEVAPEAAAPALPPAQPLPFRGRLVNGDPGELPESVAMSLSDSSLVAFSYREELTHDEYHIPLIFSALDPVTYFGAPIGDWGVTAFASLSITDGDRILADYTAKVHVSKSYNLYSEPAHKELEQAARAAVRAKIDQKVHRDAARIAQAIDAANVSGASGK